MEKHYEIIRYPDGQISVKVNRFPAFFDFRIASYEDLFVLKSLVDVYKYNGAEIYKVSIPCLFGQRSDRRFDKYQSFDLKNICEFINSLGIPEVEVQDPHSDVCLGMLNNSTKGEATEFVEYTVETIIGQNNNLVLVSPDAGAYKKVFEYGTKLKLPVVAATKHRDLEGKIDLQFIGNVKDKDCLIIDDLCDGGYTFIVLAKKLKEQGAKEVYLYVTHAYFSKGLDLLKENITHIYCTNSVKDIEDPFITQYKIIL